MTSVNPGEHGMAMFEEIVNKKQGIQLKIVSFEMPRSNKKLIKALLWKLLI